MTSLWGAATAREWMARAEAWVPAIMRRVEEATSADKAYEWMREHEQYIPRRFVREVWRREKEASQYIPTINQMPDEQLIPQHMHRTTESKMRRNVRYIVEISGRDVETGIPGTRRAAIDTDYPLTVGEVLDDAMSFADIYGFALAGPDFGVSIAHAFHASGRGWE